MLNHSLRCCDSHCLRGIDQSVGTERWRYQAIPCSHHLVLHPLKKSYIQGGSLVEWLRLLRMLIAHPGMPEFEFQLFLQFQLRAIHNLRWLK